MTRGASFFSFREPVCFGISREYAFSIFHNKRAAALSLFIIRSMETLVPLPAKVRWLNPLLTQIVETRSCTL
jgi:hypothetical protein